MSDITNFKTKWLGQRIDFDHTYGYQCVDLVRQYFYENYGLGDAAGGVGGAINYWNNTPRGVLSKFDRVDGSAARNGDVVILYGLPGNPYGHIGIGTGNINDTKVEILEQNGSTGNGSGVGPDAIRTRWVDRTRVAGLLRPKEETPAPQPTQLAPSTGDAYTVERIADKQIKLNKHPTSEWDLSHTEWAGFETNPINHEGGEVLTVRAIATHRLGGAYYMQNPDVSRGFNLVDCEDYTAPVVEAPVPTPENYATHYTYEKLETPLKLQIKSDGLNKWDLNFDDYKNVKSVEQFKKGDLFVAYGRASRNDLGHEVYFMTEADFGTAPGTAHGVNTVDLEPYAEPVVTAPTEPVVDAEATETLPASDGEAIEVHVTPTDPNKWKESFNTVASGDYTATESVVVKDLEQIHQDKQLYKGQVVHAAGSFTKDHITYLRTKKAASDGLWYGVPITAAELDELDEDDDVFSLADIKLKSEMKEAIEGLTLRKHFIISWATLEGFIRGIFSRKTKN